jgi:hypothetical protein
MAIELRHQPYHFRISALPGPPPRINRLVHELIFSGSAQFASTDDSAAIGTYSALGRSAS